MGRSLSFRTVECPCLSRPHPLSGRESCSHVPRLPCTRSVYRKRTGYACSRACPLLRPLTPGDDQKARSCCRLRYLRRTSSPPGSFILSAVRAFVHVESSLSLTSLLGAVSASVCSSTSLSGMVFGSRLFTVAAEGRNTSGSDDA